MNEHPNAAVMRRAYAAFAAGDLATMSEILHPEIRFHVPGRASLSATYTGRDATFGYFGKLMELTGGTFRLENIELFPSDFGGVYLDRLTATREGKTLDLGLCLVVRIVDGRFVEAWDHFEDTAAWDAFWA
jgi:ketosteroid isomerase-like protein